MLLLVVTSLGTGLLQRFPQKRSRCDAAELGLARHLIQKETHLPQGVRSARDEKERLDASSLPAAHLVQACGTGADHVVRVSVFTGALGRLRMVLYNRPGTLAEATNIFARNRANVVNLQMIQRDDPFGTFEVDLEVNDVAHLGRITGSLRASEAVAEAERI